MRTALGRSVLAFAGAIVCAGLLRADNVPSGPAAEQRLFDLLNSERIQQKLPALSLDQDLVEAARKHSEAMAKGKRLAHQMPGEASLNPRIAAAGARFDAVAENVAHSGSVEDAHVEFMHSAGHRANILSREYDAVGIGIPAAQISEQVLLGPWRRRFRQAVERWRFPAVHRAAHRNRLE